MNKCMDADPVPLIIAAVEACRDAPFGRAIEFECPNCGGLARAVKAGDNGHRYIRCDGCDMSIME